MTDNHKMLYEHKEPESYFGSQLDWYGVGENPISDKWQAIKDYKYHIVIENKNNNMSKTLRLYRIIISNACFGAQTQKIFSKNHV